MNHMLIDTHILNSRMARQVLALVLRSQYNKCPNKQVKSIHMQPMADIKTTWPCGVMPWLNKDSSRAKAHQVLRDLRCRQSRDMSPMTSMLTCFEMIL